MKFDEIYFWKMKFVEILLNFQQSVELLTSRTWYSVFEHEDSKSLLFDLVFYQ